MASKSLSFSVQPAGPHKRRTGITLQPQAGSGPTDGFYAELHNTRVHVELHRGGPTGPIVATARFLPCSTKTDIHFLGGRGGNVTMKLGGIGSTGGLFISKSNHVALPGAPADAAGPDFTWKGTTRTHMGMGGGGALELVDKKGRVWANFEKGEPGSLQIQPGGGPDFVDQVVLTALAIWEKTRADKQTSKNNGPGGGGGGGA